MEFQKIFAFASLGLLLIEGEAIDLGVHLASSAPYVSIAAAVRSDHVILYMARCFNQLTIYIENNVCIF